MPSWKQFGRGVFAAAALTVLGAALSFAVFSVYPLTVGAILRAAGMPPAEWFGSDYVDTRGSFVIMTGELVCLGLILFAVGGRLRRRFGALSRSQAFSLTSPLAFILGYMALRAFVPGGLFPYEFHEGSLWTALVGWPILWHLVGLASREAGWLRSTGVVVAYSLALLALGLYRTYQIHPYLR